MGASQGHSISSPRGTGQANMVPRLRLDGDVSGGIADTVCLRKERLVIVTINGLETKISRTFLDFLH